MSMAQWPQSGQVAPAVIAIDGPSGVGKSTVAKQLAQCLGYRYVDSGSMYRAMGWAVQAAAVPLDATLAIVALVQRTAIELTFCDGLSAVWVDGQQVTSQLRGESVGAAASAVATVAAVRDVITAHLRRTRRQGDSVIEGRDIGTVVFPDATLKYFLDASLAVRGQRRFCELQRAGQAVRLEQVLDAVAARDAQDRSRAVAPLVPAFDARIIDTSDLSVDEVVQLMLSDIHLNHLQGGERA
jgi:cytidylate kinase